MMSDLEYVAVPICKERMKGLEARIDKVEAVTDELHKLTLAVERLTLTVSNMVKQQEVHESRLDVLESKDGEMWRSLTKYVITAIAGIIVGYAMKNIGF